jgi:hypothetical protein
MWGQPRGGSIPLARTITLSEARWLRFLGVGALILDKLHGDFFRKYPLLRIRGILSFFRSGKCQDRSQENQAPTVIVVDLSQFKIASTLLEAPVSDADPFQGGLTKAEVFKPSVQ